MTGLEQHTDTNEFSMNLCLGNWCQKWIDEDGSNLQSNILRHPWDDTERYEEDYSKVMSSFNSISSILAKVLSKELNAPDSERYWQIILGPWLSRFLTIVEEHEVLISEVLSRYPDNKISYLYPKTKDDFCASNSGEAIKHLESREFNAHLYSNLLRSREDGDLNYFTDKLSSSDEYSSKLRLSLFGSIKTVIKKIIYFLLSRIFKLFYFKYVYIASYLSLKDRIKISWSNRTFSVFSLPIDNRKVSIDVNLKLRKNLSAKASDELCEKDRKLIKLVFEYMPKCFLESFNFYYVESNKITKGCPAAIINGIGDQILDSEISRFWIARKILCGAKLITRQHGGVFGSAKFMMFEQLQRNNSDIFLSWGWTEPGVKPMPLSPIKKGLIPKLNSKRITIVLVAFPLFFYHMFPSPQSSKFLPYIRTIKKLCVDLKNKLSISITLRRYPKEYSWDVEGLFKDLDVEITKFPDTTLKKNLNSSSLAIVTYDSSSHLEIFRHNYPTLLFFNPDFIVPRENARVALEYLKRVGVLHEDVNSVLEFLETTLPNIDEWWFSEETQNAVNFYKSNFVLESKDFANHWENLLTELKNYN